MQRRANLFRLLAVFQFLFSVAGWDVEQTLQELAGESPSQTAENPPSVSPSDSIRIASFNIQVFGKSKMSKPEVVKILVEVVRRFDIVAIQEIRSVDQTILPQFVELINQDGSRYDYVIGPRLGRTSSKEQYAYVFNTARIELDRTSVTTMPDRYDLFHREPFIATFQVRGEFDDPAFRFTLVNIHTDPDEADLEVDALAELYRTVQRGDSEDDVILLGDLNVDEEHYGRLGEIPNITWALSDVTTNTRATKAYDNILFDRTATTEYTGASGVFDLMAEFHLTLDEALDVSDHLPVWAAFTVTEDARGPLAARDSAAAE